MNEKPEPAAPPVPWHLPAAEPVHTVGLFAGFFAIIAASQGRFEAPA